jgi:hypothetical protein
MFDANHWHLLTTNTALRKLRSERFIKAPAMPIFDWFKKKRLDPGIEALIAELEAKDHFKYAEAEKVPGLKDEMRSHCYPFPYDLGRQFFADAEDLAEGGVANFLNEIGPFLRRQGVQFGEASDQMDEEGDGYWVTVNGQRYRMATAEELDLPPWEIVTANCFSLVDELLIKASSDERVYCLYFGGNEQSAVFLTPQLEEIIQRWPMDERERPLPSRRLLSAVRPGKRAAAQARGRQNPCAAYQPAAQARGRQNPCAAYQPAAQARAGKIPCWRCGRTFLRGQGGHPYRPDQAMRSGSSGGGIFGWVSSLRRIKMSSGAEIPNLTLFPSASTTVTQTLLPMTTFSPTFLLRTSMDLILAIRVRVVCGMPGHKPCNLSRHRTKRGRGARIRPVFLPLAQYRS